MAKTSEQAGFQAQTERAWCARRKSTVPPRVLPGCELADVGTPKGANDGESGWQRGELILRGREMCSVWSGAFSIDFHAVRFGRLYLFETWTCIARTGDPPIAAPPDRAFSRLALSKKFRSRNTGADHDALARHARRVSAHETQRSPPLNGDSRAGVEASPRLLARNARNWAHARLSNRTAISASANPRMRRAFRRARKEESAVESIT